MTKRLEFTFLILLCGVFAAVVAYGATQFTLTVVSAGDGRQMERYENDEAICYFYKGSLSCLSKLP